MWNALGDSDKSRNIELSFEETVLRTQRIVLHSPWYFKELHPRGNSECSDLDWLPAEVPGNVHLDLVRAGVIEDPYRRLHERGCAWVDETDWVYQTTFQVEELPANPLLVFNGLDTIAEISLNGVHLASTDNMFIPHEISVGDRLQVGENRLEVIFRSALRIGRQRQQDWMISHPNDTLRRPHWFVWGPRSFVRKAQYMYGWDWGPELVSCGIWREVVLLSVPVARLCGWRHTVHFREDESAEIVVEAEIERAPGHEATPLNLTARLTGPFRYGEAKRDLPGITSVDLTSSSAAAEGRGVLRQSVTLRVVSPVRWEPNSGVGALEDRLPALYNLELALWMGEECLDRIPAHIGLRTIRLLREPDAETGESFRFEVNGVPIFAKGANWIPADSFPGRLMASASRLETMIAMAAETGFNMLRVWGGGLYESEEFYNLCDRYGILVWQDFPYSCAFYPDIAEYAEASRREAEIAVRRIRNHPSLALWCGNNENHQLDHDQWQGADNPAPRYLGERLYHAILPSVVSEHDPAMPYWPSSPYGGDNPNSQERGDRHNWDIWHGHGDWRRYVEDHSRFLSEFGFASSCSLRAWESCLDPQDLSPRSPAVRWHDKTRKGYETYLGYIAMHFPEPQSLEDLVYYSQLNQMEALKTGIEHWRRQRDRCGGTLFWQFNDCWPVQSWSVIDWQLEPKAALYACRRFYAPLLVSLVLKGEEVQAHMTSDLQEPVQGEIALTVETFDGDILTEEREEAFVDAGSSSLAASIHVAQVLPHAREVYLFARFTPHWPVGQERIENFLFLTEPKNLKLSSPQWKAEFSEGRGEAVLTITTRRFAPYVWVRFDGCDQVVHLQDNFFHMRAGERRDVTVRWLSGSREKLLSGLRLRSLS
jgi:beta-mannosidase